MRVRLLGPVDVGLDGGSRPVNGLRRKAVLAALALHDGQVVSTDRLVDVVWGESAPATAVNTLQTHISYLRGVLGSKDAILARPPGYLLNLGGEDTDAQAAERLLRQGKQAADPAQGARDLRGALALWRGRPLADVTGSAWLEEQSQRLELLADEVRRALFEVRLAAGEHTELVSGLERMVAEHPLDERIHAQLMLALYRSGRQADALAVSRGLRHTLGDQLGIDPGQPLRDLEMAILQQDPALDASRTPEAPSAAVPAPVSVAPVPARPPSAVPPGAAAMVGRAAELAQLDGLLAAARQGRSNGLLLHGEPGIGKTMLLDYLAGQGGELWVLRVCGVEFESELAFSGLLALVRPVLRLLDDLPPHQAAALRVAFAMTDGDGPVSRLAVYAATLGLLALAARRKPLLCLVDDAHWLDRASAEALLFTARRSADARVSVVFAARDVPGFAACGIPGLAVSGLDAVSGAELARRAGELSPGAAASLVTATAGNPLALIELPALLTSAQRRGEDPLDQPLTTAGKVEAAFLEQVRPLPAGSQQALLMCALCDGGDLGLLSRALAADGLELRALDAAVAARLVSVRGDSVAFRHPLVRSAVYSAAGPGQRQAAHLRLAVALDHADDADRRAWHLASATAGRDESVAAALVDTAQRARRRGGVAAQARALERAAQLSGDSAKGMQRLWEAAAAWVAAGAVGHGAALYEDILRSGSDPAVRAKAQGGLAYLAFSRGAGTAARDRFIAEAEAYAAQVPRAAAGLMSLAMNCDVMRLDAPGMLRICERAAELGGGTGAPHSYLAATIRLAYARLLCGVPGGLSLARSCVALTEQRPPDGMGTELAEVLTWVEDYDDARRLLERDITHARRDGDVLLLAYALPMLAVLELRLGRPRAAQTAAAESVDVSGQIGQPWQHGHALATLAMAEAVLGDEAGCREAAGQARRQGPAAFADVEAKARYALGLASLGAGRAGDAARNLAWVADRLRSGGVAEPGFLPVAADLAEAYVLLGRHQDAAAVVAHLAESSQRAGRRGCQAAAARCRALLTGAAAAETWFTRALELHDQAGPPFERARTLLCLGHQRGRRHQPDADGPLEEALAIFDDIGAAAWAEQCRAEIARDGRRRKHATTV